MLSKKLKEVGTHPCRYPAEIKRLIGQRLSQAAHGSQEGLASFLAVSTRTLRTWKRQAASDSGKMVIACGRKSHAVTYSERIKVAREWRRQGFVGERAVARALPEVRLRVVRETLRELNIRQRRRQEKRKNQMQQRVKVKMPGIITAIDGATVKKRGGDYIVCRDRGSFAVKAKRCRTQAARAEDTLGVLAELKESQSLPLVIASDNGSPFCAEKVKTFLQEEQVIHLKSLPRVPQHNGSAEQAVFDFKRLVDRGLDPEKACKVLNENRLRASLGYLTPVEVEAKNHHRYTPEERTTFFNTASAAIKLAMIGIKGAIERRKAEREAIFQTLESFSFITRTKGYQPLS